MPNKRAKCTEKKQIFWCVPPKYSVCPFYPPPPSRWQQPSDLTTKPPRFLLDKQALTKYSPFLVIYKIDDNVECREKLLLQAVILHWNVVGYF